jgi:hypothetical protein
MAMRFRYGHTCPRCNNPAGRSWGGDSEPADSVLLFLEPHPIALQRLVVRCLAAFPSGEHRVPFKGTEQQIWNDETARLPAASTTGRQRRSNSARAGPSRLREATGPRMSRSSAAPAIASEPPWPARSDTAPQASPTRTVRPSGGPWPLLEWLARSYTKSACR